MRKIVATLVVVLCSASARADLVITQDQEQIHPGGTNSFKVILKYKGKKRRVDSNAAEWPTSTITDFTTGKHFTLQHRNKTYETHGGASPSQVKEEAELAAETMSHLNRIPSKRPQLRATGRTETINGWKAVEYAAETPSMKGSWWIAAELAWAQSHTRAAMTSQEQKAFNQRFPDLSQVRGYPVLTVLEQTFPGAGLVKTSLRVVSIQEKDLPDSDFVLPPGYAEIQLPGASNRRPKP